MLSSRSDRTGDRKPCPIASEQTRPAQQACPAYARTNPSRPQNQTNPTPSGFLGFPAPGVARTRGAKPAQVPSGSFPSISCSIASTAALSGARSWLTIRQTRGSFTRG